jgi:hypothetical protein
MSKFTKLVTNNWEERERESQYLKNNLGKTTETFSLICGQFTLYSFI